MQTTSILKNDPTAASRYLADQLSETERAAFEARLMTDAAAVEELEATARLKLGLRRLRAEGRLDALIHEPKSRAPWLAAAAVAFTAVAVGFVVMSWNSARPLMLAASAMSLTGQNGSPLSTTRAYAVFRQRGDSYDTLVPLPASQQAIELRVLPDLDAQHPPPYRASLVRLQDADSAEPASPRGSVAGLQPAADGFVSLFLDSAQLRPGDYLLDVSSQTHEGPGTAFVIRVTPPE